MKRTTSTTPTSTTTSSPAGYKPGFNPSGVLRAIVEAQGYDPGDPYTCNGDDARTYHWAARGSQVPGEVLSPTDPASGYDHPPIGPVGMPPMPKHSPRANSGRLPVISSGKEG